MITPRSLRIGVAAVTLVATAIVVGPFSDPVELRFAYTPDAIEVVEGSISRFNDTHRGEIHVTGTDQRSGEAMEAIIAGGGGLPHVWMPASSAWAYLVEEDVPDSIPEVRPLPGTFWSPEIIGTWPAVQEHVGSFADLERLARDDSDLEVADQPFRWAHPKPKASTSGLFTLVSEFYLATGGRLTVGQVADDGALDRVEAMELSVRNYGDIADDFCPSLDGMNGSFVTAFYMQETTLDPEKCADAVPVRPPDWYAADYPCIAMEGWTTTEERAAAQTFCDWLGEDITANVDLEALRFETGRPWGEPGILEIPPGDVLKQIRASWDQVRKRAQVTIVLEHSYETSEHLEDMKGAVEELLDELDDVTVRFITFGETFKDEDVLGPEALGVAEGQISAELEDLRSREGSDVVLGNVLHYVFSRDDVLDEDTINVVVLLASGVNGAQADEIPYDTMDHLRQGPSPVPVFAWWYGGGAAAGKGVMQRIAHASGGLGVGTGDTEATTSDVIEIVASMV